MFTGIVTDVGEVASVEQRAEGLRRLTLACRFDPASIALGASISCSGVCMTVVAVGEERGRPWFSVDAAAETLDVTTVGRWRQGRRVNLERSLKIGDELGGHLVSGHVDGMAEVIAREDLTDMARLALRARPPRSPSSSRKKARWRSTASRSRSTRSRRKNSRFSSFPTRCRSRPSAR